MESLGDSLSSVNPALLDKLEQDSPIRSGQPDRTVLQADPGVL
ncbi:MAG: hypothetical protein AB7P52_07335 [Alphaproteobacteria bacterium]